MQLFPAIDIKDDAVLRLNYQDPTGRSRPLRDPFSQAEAFVEAGATWLHVVDIDRALGTGRSNTGWIRRICAIPGVSVQVGGNVDTPEWAEEAVDAGAARVVLGTGAAQSGALERMLDIVGLLRAAVNIDVRGGKVVTRTGNPMSLMTPRELARRARDHGVSIVVYRDLERDGLALGADLVGAARLSDEQVAVIAAGGVASLDELAKAMRLGLAGVIVGRSLYEGRFTLQEAMACSA